MPLHAYPESVQCVSTFTNVQYNRRESIPHACVRCVRNIDRHPEIHPRNLWITPWEYAETACQGVEYRGKGASEQDD
jgi:hypothetical protein